MKCQYCGNEIPAGSKNCPSCGAAAPQPPPQPPKPQYQQRNNFQQGGNFQQPPCQPGMNNYGNVVVPPGYSRKSRALFIVIGLFLGGLGIHNFYAGYNNKGIAQLLITLILGWLVFPLFGIGIWVIIEILTVTKDANGIPFD